MLSLCNKIPKIYVRLGMIIGGVLILSTFSCKHDPIVPGDAETICYEKDIKPILMSNCAYAGCHDPITMEEDYDFSSYQGVMASGTVKPGDPNDSKMYKAITDKGEDFMPPPPKPKLSTANIGLIYLWIKQGALEKCN